MSEESQTVIARYDDNVILASEVASILVPGASGPYREAAPVVVKHHRTTTMIDCGRPNVEYETVFGREWFLAPKGGPGWLKRWRSGRECITSTSPRHERCRCFETVLAGDWPRVWDAFECNQIALAPTAKASIGGFYF